MRLSPRIRERLRREFFPEDYATAHRILTRWQTKKCAPWETATRMHAAALNLARGNLPDLRQAIREAQLDFRDVLHWGESRQYKRLRCVECDPGEAVADLEEEAFLQAIAANPSDSTARLVYADWLEERGDPRADYLRVLCEWLVCRPPRGQHLVEHERELREGLGRGWLARVRGMPILARTSKRR